jgi:HicB-like protein involved in pilus formation
MVGAPSLTEETAASGDGAEVKPNPEAGARHSGKLLVRMPATLHDELAHAAEAEGVSLNQWITGALAAAVGWRGAGERPAAPAKAGTDAAEPPTEATRSISPRLTRVALAANLVVLLIAAAAAIALLVAAWQAGI